jgi:gluconolactonase
MSYRVMAPEFEALIDRNEPVRSLATGFKFTEGPIWHPTEHYLLFSDMPGDVRRRWDADRGVQEVRRPANKCNGMTYDADLNLIVCEHATSSLIRETPDGGREVLASHFEGQELNSPNDVCVRSDGSIYFSDPWYGRMPVYGVERRRELGWQGVFRLPPGGGGPQLVVPRYDFAMPNGLCFSPDERLLYINDSERGVIRVYDVAPDGTLRRGRILADGLLSRQEPGIPDGMKCDERGNIWCTGPGGIWVFAPTGTLLGRIAVPEVVGNLHWGGADFRTLFLAASTSVYTVRTRVGPHLEPFMRAHRAPAAKPVEPRPAARPTASIEGPLLDPSRAVLIIQDLQNDVITEGGAFASSGAPAHAARQNIVENVRRLAQACRSAGVPVIHVWFVVEPGAAGLTLNAPIFQGIRSSAALVRGSWGAAPAAGLEPKPGDFIVEKMRMSAWEGTRLETILKSLNRDTIINTGAWTNMSVEHTARVGADKGYVVVMPQDGCSTIDDSWQKASIDFAIRNVAKVTTCAAVEELLRTAEPEQMAGSLAIRS